MYSHRRSWIQRNLSKQVEEGRGDAVRGRVSSDYIIDNSQDKVREDRGLSQGSEEIKPPLEEKEEPMEIESIQSNIGEQQDILNRYRMETLDSEAERNFLMHDARNARQAMFNMQNEKSSYELELEQARKANENLSLMLAYTLHRAKKEQEQTNRLINTIRLQKVQLNSFRNHENVFLKY